MGFIASPAMRQAPYATSADGERARFVGVLYGCGPGVHDFMEELETTVRLQGGIYWCRGASVGDTVSLDILNPSEEVVAEYVSEIPLAPWDHTADLMASTAAVIPAGYKIRVRIVCAAELTLGVTFRWWENV
jgi:hypothetical protein